MAIVAQTFNPAEAKFRMGWQLCPGLPALTLDFHARLTDAGESLRNNPEVFQRGVLSSGIDRAPDEPALIPCNGDLNLELDAEEALPFYAQMQQKGSVSSPEAGVFVHKFSPLETTIDFANRLLTIEMDRGDGLRQLTVDCHVETMTITSTAGDSMRAVVAIQASRAYYWDDARLRSPTAADAPAVVRGLDKQSDWEDLTGPLLIKQTEVITPLLLQDRATKVVAKRGLEQVLTGTWTVGAGTNTFTGSGGAALTELESGDFIDAFNELLEVDVVSTNDAFTTIANHVAGLAGALLVETFGPTESTLPTPLHNKRNTVQYGQVFDSRDGSFLGDRERGHRVEMRLDATGLTDPPQITLTGTITHTLGADTLVGAGTLFLTELKLGQIVLLGDSIEHRIATIADDTNATTIQVRVDATSAGAALTTPPYWDVAQERADWVPSLTSAPVNNNINAIVKQDGAEIVIDDFEMAVAFTVDPAFGLGTRFSSQGGIPQGQRDITVGFSEEVRDQINIKGAEVSGKFALVVRAEGAKNIGATKVEFLTVFTTGNLTFTSPRPTVESPTEYVAAIEATASEDPGGTFPEALLIEVTNTIADITPPAP